MAVDIHLSDSVFMLICIKKLVTFYKGRFVDRTCSSVGKGCSWFDPCTAVVHTSHLSTKN